MCCAREVVVNVAGRLSGVSLKRAQGPLCFFKEKKLAQKGGRRAQVSPLGAGNCPIQRPVKLLCGVSCVMGRR